MTRDPIHLADLIPDPQNRQAHTPRNLALIVDALHQVGAARSIVIDEDDVVLAGNGVIEAAADAGITKLRVIEADGHEIIAVRRRHLTPEQKRQLAMYDNRAAELATWNIPLIQADLEAGLDLTPFFRDDELKALFAQADGDLKPVGPTPTTCPPSGPIVKLTPSLVTPSLAE